MQEIMVEWEQEGGECKNTDGWISKGMWMKVKKSQAGSELPSGREDRSTEITSKPDATELQMSTDYSLSFLFTDMSPNSLLHPSALNSNQQFK